ncbi:MAG: transketolase [Microcoleus sp. PH2017_10_PVI_O_A]|uniref:transketolase family protein n=1 Tax=unclassified Microcoleus TaxID=2642155 RepID=UPI001D5B109A|nr:MULTISPECIES: transketolase C-terminal domain-containing protein [unclassified Microcoleus]TAE80567.1 MAG: transketolase [Oscillatoriales cyanobacterium]MCC3405788.1 transketolase [Microcoleus sp. PH2017_10_PVI_O_A]MCC3459907.1 transketolase [Microcoleus sp. PH2017_11_PCY_U_A]MCC3478293.1 transketolase [Microcoleus sp. PH2017_12_PCY_D_A]MCC3559274.1 transketolase [Microcoleus sp. PH2017_27_LUM_O_A]
MRNEFAAELSAIAAEDDRVVLLSGDIGNRLFDKYKASFPDRFYNCGVAEANMMSVAAGMAMSGLRPITYTITPFTTTRCLEQIRVDVCYHKAPVIVVGVGAGLSYAGNGPTHHSCEDIAILRTLPNMTVICPGDAWEVRSAMRACLQQDNPAYIRMGKKGEPLVHEGMPDFEIGKAIVMRQGSDVCLLSTGNMLPNVLQAAEQLGKQGVSAQVVSFHTVKPLDGELLDRVFSRFWVVAAVEEHSIVGGFGGAVAEWMSDRPPQKARLLRIGVADKFLHEAGEQEYAREYFGLTPSAIADKTFQMYQAIAPLQVKA